VLTDFHPQITQIRPRRKKLRTLERTAGQWPRP
jgi:hypothetical protein